MSDGNNGSSKDGNATVLPADSQSSRTESAQNPRSGEQPKAQFDQNRYIPWELRYVAIAVGLLLFGAGIAGIILGSSRAYGVSVLSLCIGFGIILAVFGANAHGRIFNFNVVGGAAITVVLYLLLYYLPIHSVEPYLKGKIEGSKSLDGVLGSAREFFFVGRKDTGQDYEFVLFESDLSSNQLYFFFDFPDENENGSGRVKELYIGCIDTNILKNSLGNNDPVILSLNKNDDGTAYTLINNKTGRSLGRPTKKRCVNDETENTVLDTVSIFTEFLSEANAQSVGVENFDIMNTLIELNSEDPLVRDSSRDDIAKLSSLEEFRIVSDEWDIASSSYRDDLGRLVGWSSAISRDRRTAVHIAESLSPKQYEYLVQLTGQGDYTLRRWSTEVLHRLIESTSWPNGPVKSASDALFDALSAGLRDPEFHPVNKQFISYSEDNRLFNTLIALEFAKCNISSTQLQNLNSELKSLEEKLIMMSGKDKTKLKLENVRRQLSSCPLSSH